MKHFFIDRDLSFRVLAGDSALKELSRLKHGYRAVYTRCPMNYRDQTFIVFVDSEVFVTDAYATFTEMMNTAIPPPPSFRLSIKKITRKK
ncbi:hypothetical protein C9J47_07345 [Photobacterium indicum]|uniref:Uncharacterized protein n=1 Tax=Photobacterium indicum TaxID=81447 RepID=A0A2T3LAJ1_9GAMM|nr:hypothetical protein C9J47_07345 [Photobacterium indicum]